MSAKNGNGGRREAAALLLAVGRSVRAAARETGVSERTLSGWKGEPEFAARVQSLRSEAFGRSVGLLCGVSVRAARTLARLLRSEDEKVQLGAARAVLESTPRLRQEADLIQRIEGLERRLQEGGK